MSDDPFYSPTHKPPPRQRGRGELIWTLRQSDITWTCELLLHGEGFGWEAVILRDSELSIGRRFILREQAIAWADAERQAIEKGGDR